VTCGFCGEVVVPPDIGEEKKAHVSECGCGALYFARTADETQSLNWKSLHPCYAVRIDNNYDPESKKAAYNLPSKYAIEHELYRVVFLKLRDGGVTE
jgi:hypothetical protein